MTLTDRRKEVQTALGVAPDGVFGPKTRAAFDTLAAATDAPESPAMGIPIALDGLDTRTVANIATLHPTVQPIAAAFMREVRAKYDFRIVDGSRTWAQQDALYEQGRTKPGKIVTNARGGYSNHNWALAFDVGLFEDGRYIDDSPKYREISAIGKRHGLFWGGDWKSPVDEPHYEYRPGWASGISEGQMLAELRTRHAIGKDAFA